MNSRQYSAKKLDILQWTKKELVERSIKLAEKQFYDGKTYIDEIRKWNKCVNTMSKVAELSELSRVWQIEEIIKWCEDPQRKFAVDAKIINKFKECYRKIRDSIPDKFSEIVKQTKKVLKYLDKYCMSFYELEEDINLETARTYETQRKELSAKIKTNVDKVEYLSHKWRTEGLFVYDLGEYGIEVCRRLDVVQAAFLALFPTLCENLRLACDAMLTWVETDKNYSQFLKNDISDLEEKREELLKEVRQHQHRYHQVNYRKNQVANELEKLEEEVEKLVEKEDELLVDVETLLDKSNRLQINMEIKEYRRDELIKRINEYPTNLYYEKYNKLTKDLRDLKHELPDVKRSIAGCNLKLNWITTKRDSLLSERQLCKQLNNELEEMIEQRIKYELEYHDVIGSLELAKKIYLYKTCPDSINKIFHQQPVEVNYARLPGKRSEDDPFEKACNIVCMTINTDWPQLYRSLPFAPTRGRLTLDRDIEEFTERESRKGNDERARYALNRWRRYHTRAKLDDLMEGLNGCGRADIAQNINSILYPKDDEEIDDFEDPAYKIVEAHLVPFLKEVERFDELKAANKI
ncbi:DgyrCDS12406 [Dimorphilus gyrociliatus]|uniref:DgyrCDS12406 n=1 Tax=Dimorphilus gyrociliatus TaxID=2664684 RepID=A0A7I8W858_9ANNE|nr:DgyrCDS12406 [Dimorphilus gyrociliatus]